MANSDPDSHEAGKKKKLDNTDGKSAFGYLEQLGTGKVEVILPSFFSFLPFVYLISRQIKGTWKRRLNFSCNIFGNFAIWNGKEESFFLL